MNIPANYRDVVHAYRALHDKDVKDCFEHLPSLVENYPLEIAISYLFAKLEMIQNRILYCGLVKLHRTESKVTKKVIDSWHITRESFLRAFDNIYSGPLPTAIQQKIKGAETTRDNIMHGKQVSEQQKRSAVVDVLAYAVDLNRHVSQRAGFGPFGDLRGFKGAVAPLEKSTTKWLLKGMDFPA